MNLSGRSFHQPEFAQQISDALLRQSGDNQQLHELTLYLTQMTAILEARP